MPPKFILEKKTLSNQQKTSFNSWYNQKKQQILQTLLFTEEEKDNLSLFIDKISNWKEFDIHLSVFWMSFVFLVKTTEEDYPYG